MAKTIAALSPVRTPLDVLPFDGTLGDDCVLLSVVTPEPALDDVLVCVVLSDVSFVVLLVLSSDVLFFESSDFLSFESLDLLSSDVFSPDFVSSPL